MVRASSTKNEEKCEKIPQNREVKRWTTRMTKWQLIGGATTTER